MLKVKQKELILPMLSKIYEEHENMKIKNILSIDITPNNMI